MSNYAMRSDIIAFRGLNKEEYLKLKLKCMGIDRRHIIPAVKKVLSRKYATLEIAYSKIFSIVLKEVIKDFDKHKGNIPVNIRTGIKESLQNVDKGNLYKAGQISRILANTIKEIKKLETVK